MRIDLGKRLREFRLARGLSETDLETRTGIPGSHISAVEEGKAKPTIDTLEGLAKGVGVELYQLLLVGKRALSPLQQDGIGTFTVREEELIWLFRSLSPADQKDLLFVGKKIVTHDPKKEGG